jgi:TorA maturation chaperone TorD
VSETQSALDTRPYDEIRCLDGDDALRANTYSLLATLLASPPSAEILDLLARSVREAGPTRGRLGEAWSVLGLAAQRIGLEALDDEYHALFIGLARGELLPYASWYLTGFLMDKPLAQLRADLAALGFARQEGVHDPEDHAAALCETMSLIIASSPEPDRSAQQVFFQRHLDPWIGQFFADLENAQSACFYRAVGHLGGSFLDFERRYLSSP